MNSPAKSVLVLFILSFLSFSAFGASTVTVAGQCNKEVSPDRFYVVMTARALEKDPSAAAKKVSAKYEEIRRDVKKMNLKDAKLQTSNYSVNPEWDYSNNKRVLRGYSASMGLRIETSEMNKAGELLTLSSKLGVQDVSSPVTFLSVALAQKEHEECLQVAVKSARGKAEKMAQAAGLKIADLASMNEANPNAGGPVPMYADAAGGMAMKSEREAVNFEIAPQNVSVTISATYNLK